MKANKLPANFTSGTQRMLSSSREAAIKLQSLAVEPVHILLGILDCEKCLAHTMLRELGIPIHQLRDKLTSDFKDIKQEQEADLNNNVNSLDSLAFSVETEQLFIKTAQYAKRIKSMEVDTDHILLMILKYGDTTTNSICEEYNLNYTRIKPIVELVTKEYNIQVSKTQEAQEDVMEQIQEKMQGQATMPDQLPTPDNMTERDKQEMEGILGRIAGHIKYITAHANFSSDTNTKTPVLDSVSKDLSKLAAEGKIDPPIGRDKEIERIAQILSRRKKNNALLIGEPGVGKTAIAEGLALKILHQEIAVSLLDKRVVSLDVGSLVAGTKYRGQFEERIQAIIHELIQSKHVILFIDEIHTIIGSGGPAGSLDLANILKPILARGDIQCIGATTITEYKNHLEKDGALARRFQNIIIEPTTVAASIDILNNIKPFYENHHTVTYAPEVIKACVELSERYITNRPLPEKAIDIMDEVGASVHLLHMKLSPQMLKIQEKIKNIQAFKTQAVQEQEYEFAATLREEEQKLVSQLTLAKTKWQKGLKTTKHPITINDVAKVIANITQISSHRIAHQEDTQIRNLKQVMQEQIIGQDEAIEKVVKAIQRTHIGLQDPHRPLGVFMFLGPTGVGKTALAKALSMNLFDNSDRLIRIDMSEYMEKIAVTRLIGAPPGYVGYEAGGQLTEKIRNNPYSVILLDEIEKAHPDVFNILLQMMDEGVLTDGLGRNINCKNAIIIMSSNVGAADLSNKNIGFQHTGEDMEMIINEKIKKNLKSTFSPEFINRLDDVVIFKTLTVPAVQEIVAIQLQKLIQRTHTLGYQVIVSQEAKNFIGQKGYNQLYGARLIKRVIQQYIEDMITEKIIEKSIQANDTIYIDHIDNSDKLTITVNNHVLASV